MRYYIGTSGWHYDHWREEFYPKGLTKSKWLEFYSRQFSTVELNSSFYHLPSERAFTNWKGSYQGWKITPKTYMIQMSKTLPGLDNFYMAGQWVNPGGSMPPAVTSGRHTIQIICKKDKKKFVTSKP